LDHFHKFHFFANLHRLVFANLHRPVHLFEHLHRLVNLFKNLHRTVQVLENLTDMHINVGAPFLKKNLGLCSYL